jgi:hypothetical protein
MRSTVKFALQRDAQRSETLSAARCATLRDARPIEARLSDVVNINWTTLPRRRLSGGLTGSDRRPHIGGALGKAILEAALKRKWFLQDLDSRALRVTAIGRRQLQTRFGLQI